MYVETILLKRLFQSFQIVQAVLATKSLIVQTLVTQLLECFAFLGLLINSTILVLVFK